MNKHLGTFHVWAIASGAMISSGIFVLPGIAYAQAGPGVVLSYVLAGLAAGLGILSQLELMSAMPKAGGNYFFISRILGPLAGTITGLLNWIALSLKTAFALVGLGQLLASVAGFSPVLVSYAALVLFTFLSLTGADFTSKIEGVLVIILFGILGWYFASALAGGTVGSFFDRLGAQLGTGEAVAPILGTASFVFVSFGGLIQVSSLAEEVKKPGKQLVRGMFLALISVTILYAITVASTVTLLPSQDLAGSLNPVVEAAQNTMGTLGFVLLSIAAAFAFVTTGNAGILTSSRYPLAMAKDRLAPEFLATSDKRGNPWVAIIVSALVMGLLLLLPIEQLVKAASTVILTQYVLAAISLLIIRSGRFSNYRPSFRVPLYPVTPILTIGLFVAMIIDVGLDGIILSLAVTALGVIVYLLVGRTRWNKESALSRMMSGIADKKIGGAHLDHELLHIFRDMHAYTPDRIDKEISRSIRLDIEEAMDKDRLFDLIAEEAYEQHFKIHESGDGQEPLDKASIGRMLREREAQASTALSDFVAVPHMVIPGSGEFRVMIIRTAKGIRWNDAHSSVKAVFALFGSLDERNTHLKMLVALAQTFQEHGFEKEWLAARSTSELRDIMLRSKRQREGGKT